MTRALPLTSAILGMLVLHAQGANLAFDNTSAFAYDDGWQTNDNGGYGWGPWSLTTAGASGHFTATSVQNGNGTDDGNIGGLPGDFDIDTTVGPVPDNSGGPAPNLTVARSWGMWANSGGVADAYRPFTGGPMIVGQTFGMDFDNGFIDNGAAVGLGLQNAAGTTLWEVLFIGGNPTYDVLDAAGFTATTVPFGTEGLNVSFTLTSPTTYSMTLTRRDGTLQTLNGNLIVDADQNIAQVRAFNVNAGSGAGHDAFYNSMSLIPEPSAALLGALGLLGILRRRR